VRRGVSVGAVFGPHALRPKPTAAMLLLARNARLFIRSLVMPPSVRVRYVPRRAHVLPRRL